MINSGESLKISEQKRGAISTVYCEGKSSSACETKRGKEREETEEKCEREREREERWRERSIGEKRESV